MKTLNKLGAVFSFFFIVGVLALSLSIVNAEQTSDSWPMFHHDLAHTGYSTSSPPNLNVTLWKYQTAAGIFSSPTIEAGVVYFGSEDKVIYAINSDTGVQVWNYTTGGGVDSSPAVSNGKVFVGSYDGSLYALDASTGKILYQS